MIDLQRSAFFLPTKKFRELTILLTILHDSDISQHDIAEKSGLSGAMVNGYVKDLRRAGRIQMLERNKRDKEYRLTQQGTDRLMQLLMHCSAEIVQLYSQARLEIITRLREHFRDERPHRVILFGGADTAQLVYSALEFFPQVSIEAIVDNDQKKWGEKLGHHAIVSPDNLNGVKFDSVVISSFARQDEIYESIKNWESRDIALIKLAAL